MTPTFDDTREDPRRTAAVGPLGDVGRRFGRSTKLGIPVALVGASVTITLAAGLAAAPGQRAAMTSLSVVAMALHVAWAVPDRALTRPTALVVVVAQAAVTAGLVWISPYFGIYAFAGYLTAGMLMRPPELWFGLGIAAVLSATAQVGGFVEIARNPVPFALMVLINGALVTVLTWFGTERERQVTAREGAVRELENALRCNADLQHELLERAREQGILEERSRLSREIHDSVAQDLVAMVSQLEAIDTCGSGAVRIGRELDSRLATAKELARSALAEARRAVVALRSPLLDTHTLPVALADLVTGWAKAQNVGATISVDGDPAPAETDPHLLRICQEALSNVARHAGAKSVQVTLTYTDEGVLLDVRDDGCGFDPDHVAEGNGLRNMRERLAATGGTVTVSSPAAGGCRVSVAVPA